MAVVFYSWRQAVLKSKLAATTKHVLVTLGCHMNDMGESCFPSIETLMEETSLSNRAIITHLDKAEQAGFIVTRKHGFAGQKWARNEYVATFPNTENPPEIVPETVEKAVNDVHHLDDKAVNVVHEGSERHDKKAVNVVHTSSSIDLSINNTACAREIPADSKPKLTPEGEYACRLRPLGVSVTSMHPTLCQWVADGVALNLLVECVEIAKDQKRRQGQPDNVIAPNYLDKIVRSELAPRVDNSWMNSDEGLRKKGIELGLPPKQGESWPDYKKRLIEADRRKGER